MKDLETLIKLAERISREKNDGDVTIFKFKTGWAVYLGTPEMDWCSFSERLWAMKICPTLDEALTGFIVDN